MANKRLSEGVGKKIVEALKKQSEIEINPVPQAENPNELESTDEMYGNFSEENQNVESIFEEENFLDNLASSSNYNENVAEQTQESSFGSEPNIAFEQSSTQQSSQPFANYQQPSQAQMPHESLINDLDNFEIPTNIAVLKKLITQLPSGVTRHTGAQIIKQTMEALGISMKSVLQEAQQVQDSLSNSGRECFSTIQEYKKQILMLEKQAQNYQKQYTALNELISLFVQTGL